MRHALIPVCFAALVANAHEADGHAFLLKADPAVGAVIAGAPKTLRLEFTEDLVLPQSELKVVNRGGTALSTQARFDGANRNVLVVDLTPLSAGAYRVEWLAISDDGHQTEGSFMFTVQ